MSKIVENAFNLSLKMSLLSLIFDTFLFVKFFNKKNQRYFLNNMLIVKSFNKNGY